MKVCAYCNKEFSRKRKPKQRFCSISCGLRNSRKSIDLSIFAEGLTERSTYVLGLIYSDGCVSKDIAGEYRITIALNDQELIEELRSIYTPDRKLYSYQPKQGNPSYMFITKNLLDISYLLETGCQERKSMNVRMPSIDHNLIGSFLRGVIDGDGSVYISRTLKPATYFGVSITTGSYGFAEDLKGLLDIYLPFPVHINKDCRKNIWYVRTAKKENLLSLRRLLYNEASLYLFRKKEIFDMII